MKFSEIPGNQRVKEVLARSVRSGRVSHAQMFSGHPGYGTLAVGIAFFQYLNCTDRHGDDSCGVCPSCRKIAVLEHPDMHFVFPAGSPKAGSQQGNDHLLPQWRELYLKTRGFFDEQMWYEAIEIKNQQGIISRADADAITRKLSFKAFEATWKAAVIWLPEKMRVEAANSLLKILEEPWERTVFILVSENPSVLLPTIISRVQHTELGPLSEQEIRGFISADPDMVTDTEIRIEDNVIDTLRGMGQDTGARREEFFELFTRLMRLCYNDRHLELFEWAEDVAGMGRETQKRFLRYIVSMLREAFMTQAGMKNITTIGGEEMNFTEKFAPYINNMNIEKLIAEVELAIAHVSQNGNPRMIYPHFALTVSKLIHRL